MGDGMVDREKVIKALESCMSGQPDGLGCSRVPCPYDQFERCEINEVLNSLPAVDAVPVIHARWKDYKDEHQCSACKEIVCVDLHTWKDIQFDFCPYCGARMDGDTNG